MRSDPHTPDCTTVTLRRTPVSPRLLAATVLSLACLALPAVAQETPAPLPEAATQEAQEADSVDALAESASVADDGTTVPPSDADPAIEGADPLATPADPQPVTTESVAPATAPIPAESNDANDPRTEAERDFAALYTTGGDQDYDPVADPTLPSPARIGAAYDPWERLNRQVHRFNNVVDRRVARPLAQAYVRIVPRPVRLGVSNFFSNLGQPVAAVNSLLQGQPGKAAQSLGRFALNTTLGIGGVFDPASDARLPNRSEDFGQTLGVWGWERSRYVELPLFGPRTVRDIFGMVGDAPLSPLRQVDADKVRIPIQGLQLVDVRTQLLSTDSLREGAEDDYALVRDAWSQRRDYQIFGDRQLKPEDELPDYLLEELNPTVPVGAMPVMPTDAN